MAHDALDGRRDLRRTSLLQDVVGGGVGNGLGCGLAGFSIKQAGGDVLERQVVGGGRVEGNNKGGIRVGESVGEDGDDVVVGDETSFLDPC